ncbi:MAG TPA: D-alanine--D-alanine ligase [Peptococcaceae bacterium]|nr:D-alanine--D-alanine ligase [Peptococcaceae bacterium]
MKINVGVFFGGKSVEHEISVISAAQAMAAIDPVKYQVIPVYITKDNELYTGDALSEIRNFASLPKLLEQCQRVYLLKEKGKTLLLRYPSKLFGNPVLTALDVAFPVVHGTNVEDGSLQGFFELHDLPYTGPDVCASAVGMDKWVMKCVLQGAGLPVLPGYCFQSSLYYVRTQELIDKLESLFEYPMIVKPVNLGSSIGISKASNADSLKDAIELAASFSGRVLVEPVVVDLKEVNCAVLGDFEYTQTSACEEPVNTDDILSYRDKYMGGAKQGAGKGAKGMGGAMRKLPADIPADVEDQIKELAQKAFIAMNCSGVARIDFLLDMADNQIYINELNTIPGSLSFYLWEAASLSFRDLTDHMIQLALKRDRQKKALIWSNETNILANFNDYGVKGAKGAKGERF